MANCDTRPAASHASHRFTESTLVIEKHTHCLINGLMCVRLCRPEYQRVSSALRHFDNSIIAPGEDARREMRSIDHIVACLFPRNGLGPGKRMFQSGNRCCCRRRWRTVAICADAISQRNDANSHLMNIVNVGSLG